MWEVADFVDTELIAVNGLVLCFQSKRRFPSWTSRVRVPSPASSPAIRKPACQLQFRAVQPLRRPAAFYNRSKSSASSNEDFRWNRRWIATAGRLFHNDQLLGRMSAATGT